MRQKVLGGNGGDRQLKKWSAPNLPDSAREYKQHKAEIHIADVVRLKVLHVAHSRNNNDLEEQFLFILRLCTPLLTKKDIIAKNS